MNASERRHCIRRGHGIGVRDEDELAARRRDALVDVGGERERPRVAQHARTVGLAAHAPRQVLDQHELVHLRAKNRHEPLDVVGVAVRDDDRGDAHSSSR